VTSEAAPRILAKLEAAYLPFRRAVEGLGPERLEETTPAGWTAKEMLAHIAFWEEASHATITSMFRGEPLPDSWSFGSGYVPSDPWPRADEHNAREAAWARPRSAAEVIARWDTAHQNLVGTVASLTDSDVAAHKDYWGELDGRYTHHLPELESLLRRTASSPKPEQP
jgi:hypothetical protein